MHDARPVGCRRARARSAAAVVAAGASALGVMIAFAPQLGASGVHNSQRWARAHSTHIQVPTDPVVAGVLDAVNATRVASGRTPYSWDPQLAWLAERWSAEMGNSGSFRHSDL